MEEHFVIPVVSAIVAALVPAILGQMGLTAAKGDGERPSTKQLVWLRTGALLLGTGVFAYLFWKGKSDPDTKPTLQSVEVQPDHAVPGTPVDVKVVLNKPAPAGGASVSLTSEDPRALVLDADVNVPEGRSMVVKAYRFAEPPANGSSVRIVAFYENKERDTLLYNSATPDLVVHPHRRGDSTSFVPHVNNTVTAMQKPDQTPASTTAAPKPPPLSPELVSRLEEAEGQLSSEEGYWQNVKEHMPPGTSLRPEISSQLSAAKSAVQRCAKAQQAQDAASLSSCIDAVNDHLTQLKIQH